MVLMISKDARRHNTINLDWAHDKYSLHRDVAATAGYATGNRIPDMADNVDNKTWEISPKIYIRKQDHKT